MHSYLEVTEGMDVLMKINEAYCDKEHRPDKDIRYTSPEIVGPVQQTCQRKIKLIVWVKVFRIIPEFRILRLTFRRIIFNMSVHLSVITK